MRKLRPLLVLVAMLGGCADAELGEEVGPDAGADEEVEPGDLPDLGPALLITPDNPVGNLSIVARPDGRVNGNGGGASVWRDIGAGFATGNAGMAAAVWSRPGDNLEIDFSGVVSASGTVWVRVLVDGLPAQPGDIAFKQGGSHAVRSFRFVMPNVGGGAHVVQVQWIGDPGATIVDHNLMVHSASPTWGAGRLAVRAAASGPSLVRTSNVWADIPEMSITMTTDAMRDLAITFSAESHVPAGQLHVRALVDGVATNDLQLQASGGNGFYGGRSAVFVWPNLSAGTHEVRIQWRAVSGTAYIGDRTVTAFSSVASQPGGGLAMTSSQSTVTSVSTSTLTLLATRNFTTTDPSSDAAITFSGEATATSTLLLRATVDGVPATPGDVVFAVNDPGRGTYTYTFHVKNQLPGGHVVRIEGLAVGGAATIRDRVLSIAFKRRHGADFAQPTEHMTPHQGEFQHVVICFNPKMTNPFGGTVRSFTWWELYFMFIGDDGHRNVTDWFAENSRGRYRAGRHWFLGCYDSPHAEPDYYVNRYQEMHDDAVNRAAQDLDFRQFDHNGDGFVHPDEAIITVVKPQRGTDGQVGGTGVLLTVPGGTLNVPVVDMWLEPTGTDPNLSDRFVRTRNVGLAVHEMSHALLGAQELSVQSAGDPYTPMDNYVWGAHLDPIHKMINGWLIPDLVETTTLTTPRTVSLRPVEVANEAVLIYDPARPNEAFLLENRWPDDSNYDGFELDLSEGIGQGGVAVWQYAFDPANDRWDPVRRPHDVTRTPPASSFLTLATAGQSVDLTWMDGTPAVRIASQSSAPSTNMTVVITDL